MGWNRKFDKCIGCGTTTTRYGGNGYCCNCYQSLWRKNNPKKYQELKYGFIRYTSRKRLNQKGIQSMGITTKFQKKILKRDGGKCVYCGRMVDMNLPNGFQNKGAFDHIISISKGGTNKYNNLVLSCQECNNTKGTKDVFEWCKEKGIKVPNIVIKLLNEG